MLSLAGAVSAAASSGVDILDFGMADSRREHGFFSPNPKGIKVANGEDGRKALVLLADPDNPYAGPEKGIYGGEAYFSMRVNPAGQNYVSFIIWGGEGMLGARIGLEIDGTELTRTFVDQRSPQSPGIFQVVTRAIPKSLTLDKRRVSCRIRLFGRWYSYGKRGQYRTFQRIVECDESHKIYAVATHPNPCLLLPSSFAAPATKTEQPVARQSLNAMDEYARIVKIFEGYIERQIIGRQYIKTDPNNYFSPISAAAFIYACPKVKKYYRNPDLLESIVKLIDACCVENAKMEGQHAQDCWGGSFGRHGFAAALLYDDLRKSQILEERVDFGNGARTRREEWIRLFLESFRAGAGGDRKCIANQVMESVESIYGAAWGLAKLDGNRYGNLPSFALRFMREGVGLEDASGILKNLESDDLMANPPVPTNEGRCFHGKGYRYITSKGTTHEPIWVGLCCYGDVGGKLVEIAMMVEAMEGKSAAAPFVAQATKLAKAQLHFTLPSPDGMRAESAICGRNVKQPGKIYYTCAEAAGLGMDDYLLGCLRRQLDDGWPVEAEGRAPCKLKVLDALEALSDETWQKRHAQSVPGPVTAPNNPDFFWADEENAVVAVKHKGEYLFVRFYSHGSTGVAHLVTKTQENFIEFVPDRTHFTDDGKGPKKGPQATATSGNAIWAVRDPDCGAPPSDCQETTLTPSWDGKGSVDWARLIHDSYESQIGRYAISLDVKGAKTSVRILKDANKDGAAKSASARRIVPADSAVRNELLRIAKSSASAFANSNKYLTVTIDRTMAGIDGKTWFLDYNEVMEAVANGVAVWRDKKSDTKEVTSAIGRLRKATDKIRKFIP